MFGRLQDIPNIPELNKRVLITLFLLAIYRVGVFVPTPGVDTHVLAYFFAKARGTILGFFDMFSGGALRRFSILSLGIMPYISASIILELLTVAVPHLERLSKEGSVGRRKINQYARYGTVILSLIQAFGISIGLEKMAGAAGEPVVLNPGWGFRFMTVITLTTGTIFLMWLGEQITERGIGNGISLIIFAGIVANMPQAIGSTLALLKTGELTAFSMVFILVLMFLVIGFIVFMERARRKIPVYYARRVVGRRVYGGQTTHLPLKINMSGVIPPIFASSILMFPLTIANFLPKDVIESHRLLQMLITYITPGKLIYILLYVVLIVGFCYFYTSIIFNPLDVADNIKKYGGYIPGIRPGKKTAEYIDRVLSRITFGGALYLSLICVLPTVLIREFNVPFYFGGTSLLIVVGVALDTIDQIQSHLVAHYYESFMKRARIKARSF